jgi:hypothetical protein
MFTQLCGRRPQRADQTNSAEYFWICRGIKLPLLPDRPVAVDLMGMPAFGGKADIARKCFDVGDFINYDFVHRENIFRVGLNYRFR